MTFPNDKGKKMKTENDININLDDYEGLMSLWVKDLRTSKTEL